MALIRRGASQFETKAEFVEYLATRTVREGECLIWLGYKNFSGYGRIRVAGVSHRLHRFVYETFVGEIPADKVIDHTCGNRACCNVKHLEAVTQKENVHRGRVVTERSNFCPHGHEFTDENTYRTKNGWRQCRACKTEKRKK